MSYFTEYSIISDPPMGSFDQLRIITKQLSHLAISAKNNSLTAQDGMTRTEAMTQQLAAMTSLLLLILSLNIEDADALTLSLIHI